MNHKGQYILEQLELLAKEAKLVLEVRLEKPYDAWLLVAKLGDLKVATVYSQMTYLFPELVRNELRLRGLVD